jgi:hypothetical protein
MMRRPFVEWMRDLEVKMVLDTDGIHSFQWTLEDEYESRLSEALEYFSARPDYLRQECIEHLIELDRLEERFLEKEEYEKCAAVRDLRADLLIRYQEYLGEEKINKEKD